MLYFFAAFMFIFTVSACGQSSDNSDDAITPAPDIPATTPDTTISSPAETTPDSIDTPPNKAEYVKITPEEAELMMADEDVVILDVRTQEEFDEGHIINAVLLPDFDISELAADVLPDKNQTILVHCRSGKRSESASRELINMGYTRVFDFGGILDWHGEIAVN